MINNLQLVRDACVSCDAQVCIIGAGTVGLFLAWVLRRQGLRVVMLEAGDVTPRSPAEMGQQTEQRGSGYRGAELGRSFGIGGTSVLWGGQMIPLADADFDARNERGLSAWPFSYSEVAKYYPEVRQRLGLVTRAVSAETATDELLQREYPDLRELCGDFDLRFSEWLPFSKRNFAKLFSGSIKADQGLCIWVNAAVCDMTCPLGGSNARIETITAKSLNGNTLHVRASTVVICAGALESTRLLLMFDEFTENSITRAGAPLGRYFGDHLSVTCGRIVCRDWRRYVLGVAPIFKNGIMRSPRLEVTGAAQRELKVNSAFVHFTFVTSGDSGLDFVRNLLRREQSKNGALRYTPKALSRMMTDIVEIVQWRFVHGRLWIPREADLLYQVDIQQAANPENRLYLAPERDALGRKRLIIDWRISPSDVRMVSTVAELGATAWNSGPLSQVADLQLTLPDGVDTVAPPYDVYHPTGSIRMGDSPANSVVDKDLRLWAAQNCYVVTTAVFPCTSSANSGLTLLALTARVAERLAQQVRTGQAM